MDNDNTNNSSYLTAFILFLLLLFVTAVIVAAVILFLPRQNVALFGACTEQSECEAGLICYSRTGGTGATGKCLGGLGYICNVNSDCANGFICLENSSSHIKMCSLPITLNQVAVQPVITSLVLPTSIPTMTFQSTNTPTTVAPINLTARQRVACPTVGTQSLLNQAFPCYNNQTSGVRYGGYGERYANTSTYRTFSPLNINIAKKKL